MLVGRHLVTAFATHKGRYAVEPPRGFKPFMQDWYDTNMPVVQKVDVRGKFMWWEVSFPNAKRWWVWITYGMSGQWSTHESKHSAFGVQLAGDKRLYFNDPRHFGTLRFIDDEAEHLRKLRSLGPDMLSSPPDEATFERRLQKRPTRTIGEVLMDQSVVSGVGNYIRAEALYLAEVSPHRKVITLTSPEMSRLRQQLINVMQASYRTGGATFSSYRNPDGSKGEAQRRFVVYGNPTDPMGNAVVKEDLGGRTIHWVPEVQR